MEEFNAKKEIESLSKTILLIAISCIGYIILGYYFTDKRLDEHKKAIIELTNKHNATINYLKAQEIHERNK